MFNLFLQESNESINNSNWKANIFRKNVFFRETMRYSNSLEIKCIGVISINEVNPDKLKPVFKRILFLTDNFDGPA